MYNLCICIKLNYSTLFKFYTDSWKWSFIHTLVALTRKTGLTDLLTDKPKTLRWEPSQYTDVVLPFLSLFWWLEVIIGKHVTSKDLNYQKSIGLFKIFKIKVRIGWGDVNIKNCQNLQNPIKQVNPSNLPSLLHDQFFVVDHQLSTIFHVWIFQ